MKVGIIDYGLGNLASVKAAVERLGAEAVICGDEASFAQVERLILPGVGSFGDGMRNLLERNLVPVMRRSVFEERKPLFGICLGFQLLARWSDEHGGHEGLGWIDAKVTRLTPAGPQFRIPHVGWNDLKVRVPNQLFIGMEQVLVYFVHSYCISDCADAVATSDHGVNFVAAIEKGPIFGVQFHPEKSQKQGLDILRNFLEVRI